MSLSVVCFSLFAAFGTVNYAGGTDRQTDRHFNSATSPIAGDGGGNVFLSI